ncbi:hypothetical protein ACFL5A_04415, partial [Gemmatimonadota bacterium]
MSPTKSSLALILALALSGGGQFLSAQGGLRGGGLGLYGLGPRLGENVELALAFQDQLGLSAEQVGSLQVFQTEIQRDVEPLENEIAGLRSGILAGEVDRVEGVLLLQELFSQYSAVAEPYQAGVENVLTA